VGCARIDSATPDEVLVAQARAGDAPAAAALIERYQDRVYNLCYRMCGHEADAADLTQATFLKALESLPSFELRSSFYTWLFRIAVNAALSHRRSLRRRPMHSLDGTDLGGMDSADRPHRPPVASAGPSPLRRLELAELHERVAGALARLAEEFRAPVVLRDMEELDYHEIAEILAVPVGTVKSRIHRGRLMLRELLVGEGLSRGPVAL
jgi:RNA polymerase sigma-70 factor (ECF subfamily)